MKVAAILAAAGLGTRLGAGKPKALVEVAGKTILRHSFEALDHAWPFEEWIVTAPAGNTDKIRKALGNTGQKAVRIVEGGRTRAISVQNALAAVSKQCDYVLIHDAARPLVEKRVVRRTLEEARRFGASLAALPVSSTVKRARLNGTVEKTVDRRNLYLAQTPQVFRKAELIARYRALGSKASQATDDAALFDGTRTRIRIVEGSVQNFKVTTPEDLSLVKFYLRA